MVHYCFQILGYLSGSNFTFMIRTPLSSTMSKPTSVNALRKALLPFTFNKDCIFLCATYFRLYYTLYGSAQRVKPKEASEPKPMCAGWVVWDEELS